MLFILQEIRGRAAVAGEVSLQQVPYASRSSPPCASYRRLCRSSTPFLCHLLTMARHEFLPLDIFATPRRRVIREHTIFSPQARHSALYARHRCFIIRHFSSIFIGDF